MNYSILKAARHHQHGYIASIGRPTITTLQRLTAHRNSHLPHARLSTQHTSPSEVSSTPPVCTLTSLDHLVLTVRSLPETIQFYTEILGMAHQSFTDPIDPNTTRHALLFGASKINLHEAGPGRSSSAFEPKARTALPGTADLCFLTDQDVGAGLVDRLRARGVEVLDSGGGGEVVRRRTGTRSTLRSIYVRDPDGNLIE